MNDKTDPTASSSSAAQVSAEQPAAVSGPPIEFKGLSHPVLRVRVRDADPDALRTTLAAMSPQGPADFEWQAAVLDLEMLDPQASPDLGALCGLLREIRLHPVAVAGGSEMLREQAESLSLGWLAAIREPRRDAAQGSSRQAAAGVSATQSASTSQKSAAAATGGRAEPAVGAMIIDRPVRSGQQIYARDCDLVVIGPVSPGAEIIADGNIHVYGSLQGRAIAGARGRRDARIFAMDLSVELVAIAGVYRTFEDGVPAADRGRPLFVRLNAESDRLTLIPL